MNAQAINFNNLLKATETQAQKSASNVFDVSDDQFSKTFNEIVSKYDKNNNATVKSPNDVKRKDSPRTENNINKSSAEAQANSANRKPEASETPKNQSTPVENQNNQNTEAAQQNPVNEANSESENTNSAQNEQFAQAETDAILEEAALNALNTEISEEIPLQPAAQTVQTSENAADAEEQRALANQKRINNLKTTSTTTVASISSDSDDTSASKGTAASVMLAEVEEGAQIKASEKVVQAAKDGTISQTQELSSQAKQSAMENLQSIQGTDTTVVESKSSAQSDTQSNSNSSFSQGNAAEQVIKMSIENADADSVVPVQNNPSSHADKALQTVSSASKTLDLNKSDILNQIGTKMQDLPETGQSKVTIILKPEHLGRIQLEILNTGDGITARMLTENQQVKELLDKNMETLKSQLGAQGVNVNNIKVENTQQTSQNAMNFDREQFSHEFSQNPQGHNPANPDSARAYEENNIEFVEDTGEIEPEIAQSQILHDGKVDYKV